MADLIKWKKDYLRVFEARCNFTPKDYDPVFLAKERAVYFMAKKRYKEDFDSYLYLALVEFAKPIHSGYSYYVNNHPFEYNAFLEKTSQELGVDCTLPPQIRATDEDVFYYLGEMTRYGRHILFSHIDVPDDAEKDFLDAIEKEDFSRFKRLKEKYPINLSTLKRVFGVFCFKRAFDAKLDKLEDLDAVDNDALFLLGTTQEACKNAFKEVLNEGEYYYSSLTEDQIEEAAACVIIAFSLYSISSIMDSFECKIIDDIFTKPEYACFSCAAQRVYYSLYGYLPERLTPLISVFEATDSKDEEKSKGNQTDSANILELQLKLPEDFFMNSEYIDGSIKTIKPLPSWVEVAGPSVFASVINLLADKSYLEPSLGNRRLLASYLSGRRLDTNKAAVEWLQVKGKELVETEKVMLWLCWFFFEGRRGLYVNAYEVLWRDKQRRIKKGSETERISHADENIRAAIKGMYPNRPEKE